MLSNFYEKITQQDISKLILKFESGDLPKDEWHHPEHVLVAYYYLNNFIESVATQKIVEGIKKINEIHGVKQTQVSGYHHTWTIFFIKLIFKKMNEDGFKNLSINCQVNTLLKFCNDFRGLSRKYYSKELIMSWNARTNWVEPDLSSRDF